MGEVRKLKLREEIRPEDKWKVEKYIRILMLGKKTLKH